MPVKSKGIGGHQSARSRTDEWLTPPEIIRELGPFDLDPCSPVQRPWDTAKRHFTIEDDGLSQNWFDLGRVWLNPPYGKQTGKWLEKLARHGNGIALVFARTETLPFHLYVWPAAHAVLFLYRRIHFYDLAGQRSKNNAGAPSVLIAYGSDNAARLRRFGKHRIKGAFVNLVGGGE